MATLKAIATTVSCIGFHLIYSQQFGTCDEPFIIFKHTTATSNSALACESALRIFPEIEDEGATKFHDGECAYQCKMALPYTCFKIHAPQTRYDEGLLSVDIFEKKVSAKWKNAMLHQDYDPFFDFNMAFWVKSLDQYLVHWQQSPDLEYFGVEWSYKDNPFYSILVHSPSSSITFEFISYLKPYDLLYDAIHWINSDIPRATFQGMKDEYPWDRDDGATIVPVRVSRATSDIEKVHDFYINLLEAQMVHHIETVDSAGHLVKSIHLLLPEAHVEVQFVQRDSSSSTTMGDFTVQLYEQLMMETHDSIITSQYCGQDRWMDNHFGFSAWTVPGLLDRIYSNLKENDIKFHAWKNLAAHESAYNKEQMKAIGYDGEYTFGVWFTDPTGMTIASGGIISDPDVAYYADFADPQWCEKECDWGLMKGAVDPTHIYQPAPSDGKKDHKVQRKRSQLESMVVMSSRVKNELIAVAVVMLSVLLFVGICRYCQKYEKKSIHSAENTITYHSIGLSPQVPRQKRVQL